MPTQRFARSFPCRYFASKDLQRALIEQVCDADVVHVHGIWNQTSSGAMGAAVRADVPFVISPRGMLQPSALRRRALIKRFAWRLRECRRCQRAMAVHATSEVEGVALRRLLQQANVVVIPNGVDLDGLQGVPGAFKSGHGLRRDDQIVLFLGRVHRIKRLDLLADAFQRVANEEGRAILVIAGSEEDPLSPATEGTLRGLGHRVIRLGHVGQRLRADLLADAALLVSCSDSESFGLGVAEALGAGVPVVATRTTPWEVLERRQLGLWVEQTPESIGSAVLELLRDPEVCSSMSQRARVFARDALSWQAAARAMISCYKAALPKRAEAP